MKKVWFTYKGHESKSSLSPYLFDYKEDDVSHNPDYHAEAIDRWGSYQPTANNSFGSNLLYPYVNQNLSKTERDLQAGAWALKTIQTPSGSVMSVDYEADDYSYVQNKRSMQLFKIAGLDDDDSGSLTNNLGDDNKRLYFDLVQPSNSTEELKEYIEGMEHLYFKAFTRLNNLLTDGKKLFRQTPPCGISTTMPVIM